MQKTAMHPAGYIEYEGAAVEWQSSALPPEPAMHSSFPSQSYGEPAGGALC